MEDSETIEPPPAGRRVERLVGRRIGDICHDRKTGEILVLTEISEGGSCNWLTTHELAERAKKLNSLLSGVVDRCKVNGGYVGLDGQYIKTLRRALSLWS